MRKPDILIALGVVLIGLAIDRLAGTWWAVGFVGVVLIWTGVIVELTERHDRRAARKDGS